MYLILIQDDDNVFFDKPKGCSPYLLEEGAQRNIYYQLSLTKEMASEELDLLINRFYVEKENIEVFEVGNKVHIKKVTETYTKTFQIDHWKL